MLRLADDAERRLGKPVIAINAATFWYTLRENRFLDQVRGFGCLLRDHRGAGPGPLDRGRRMLHPRP